MSDREKLRLTCFRAHESLGVPCEKTECRQWLNDEKSVNCTLIAAQHGPMTLQQIGDLFGVTRMRICQIEKIVIQKMSEKTSPWAD